MQELEEHFNTKLEKILGEIHSHLESQDIKLQTIMNKLEVKDHDN